MHEPLDLDGEGIPYKGGRGRTYALFAAQFNPK